MYHRVGRVGTPLSTQDVRSANCNTFVTTTHRQHNNNHHYASFVVVVANRDNWRATIVLTIFPSSDNNRPSDIRVALAAVAALAVADGGSGGDGGPVSTVDAGRRATAANDYIIINNIVVLLLLLPSERQSRRRFVSSEKITPCLVLFSNNVN